MAWVTPTGLATNDLVSAAKWNQDVKDNTIYLKSIADGLSVAAGTLAATGQGGHSVGSAGDGELGIGIIPGYPLHVLSDDPARIGLEQRSADTTPPEIFLLKSRGSLATPGDVSAGDGLGDMVFYGYRTGGYRQSSYIYATAPTVGSSIVSGQLQFFTTTAAGTPTEAMRITEAQRVLFADGSVALPSVALLNSPDTGLYHLGGGALGIACNANKVLHLDYGASAIIGFFGGIGSTKTTVTGSRGANAALASLLTALSNYGLITDSSS